jgi:hypothetical protein
MGVDMIALMMEWSGLRKVTVHWSFAAVSGHVSKGDGSAELS